jgi:hypothetical protein
MNLFSLLGVEMVFASKRKEDKVQSFDKEVHHYENKKHVQRNADKFGKSTHWTIDSQFWD